MPDVVPRGAPCHQEALPTVHALPVFHVNPEVADTLGLSEDWLQERDRNVYYKVRRVERMCMYLIADEEVLHEDPVAPCGKSPQHGPHPLTPPRDPTHGTPPPGSHHRDPTHGTPHPRVPTPTGPHPRDPTQGLTMDLQHFTFHTQLKVDRDLGSWVGFEVDSTISSVDDY